MAGEIKATLAIECLNGNFRYPREGQQLSINQASPGGGVPGIHLATNAAQGTALPTTGLTTPGWIKFKNLDTVATVEWGPDSGGNLVLCGKLLPGEEAAFRLGASVSLRFRSSIASSKIHAAAFET